MRFSLTFALALTLSLPASGSQSAAPGAAVDSLLLRARSALDRGGLPDSLVLRLRAVIRDPGDTRMGDALGLLGRHYAMAGRAAPLDTVLSLFANLSPSDARAAGDRHLLTAQWYRLQGRADSALAHLGRALLLREGAGDWSGVVEVYDAYGRVTEQLVGDPGGALAYYTRAVATGRDRAPESALLATALLRSGHMASRLGQTTPALEFYRQADAAAQRIGLDGVSALARYHSGEEQLQRQGRVQPAATELHRAVAAAEHGRDPYAVRARLLAHQLLGDIHYQYGSSHDSALAAYELAIHADDGAAQLGRLLIGSYRNAGIIHAWWDRDARAEPLLRRAAQLADESDDEDLALSNRGHWIAALVRVGKLQEAIRALAPVRADMATSDGTMAVALGAIVQANDRDSGVAFDAEPWARVFGTPATMDAFFRSAIDMALARDDIETLLFALFEYGRSLLAAGRLEEAQRTLRSAWNQAARKGRDDERRALDRHILR
jgi:tetratricopeptide (TPR) repeat protein